MAQHLGPEELIDLVEDRERLLGAGRAAHLKSCQSCRQQVQELRGVMFEADDVTVPEPSPLFWEHSSKRLSEAVEVDARSHEGRRWKRLSLSHMTTALTTATVVLAVVLGLPFLRAPSERSAVGGLDAADGGARQTTTAGQPEGISTDEPADWADGEAELFMVDGRAISTAVFELTLDERQALVQLLEAELEGML
jgi:anti-sigma-K factor RskA